MNLGDFLKGPSVNPRHYATTALGGFMGLDHPAHQRGRFSYLDIERMRMDPQIQMGLRILRAPIYTANWEVDVNDEQAKEFANKTINKFWNKDLPKALRIFEYGIAGGEYKYRLDDHGRVEYVCFKDAPFHTIRPLAVKDHMVGIKADAAEGEPIKKGDKKNWIMKPRFAWFIHEQEYSRFYGVPRLQGAWEPWMEKTGKHGARDVRRLWFYKNVFRGMMIRHPMGFIEVDGQMMSCQQYAREIVEKMETGGVAAIPYAFDEDTGRYVWEIIDAQVNGDGKILLEYPETLDKEMLVGLGIPPEIIQASETGSGWSGRKVPMLVFLKSEDQIVDAIISTFKAQCLDHLMEINYGIGPDDYEVNPVTLVPPEPGVQQQQAGGDQQAGMGSPTGGSSHEEYIGPRGGHWKIDPETGKKYHAGQLSLEVPQVAKADVDGVREGIVAELSRMEAERAQLRVYDEILHELERDERAEREREMQKKHASELAEMRQVALSMERAVEEALGLESVEDVIRENDFIKRVVRSKRKRA